MANKNNPDKLKIPPIHLITRLIELAEQAHGEMGLEFNPSLAEELERALVEIKAKMRPPAP